MSNASSDEKVRALVVDDTVLYRQVLTQALESTGEAVVVGAVAHGRLALGRLEHLEVDVVLLDVEMPELDGPATLAEIRKLPRPPIVIMVSGQTTRSTQSTLDALANGAFDFIRKPEGRDADASRKELVDTLRPLLRHVKTVRNLRQGGCETAAGPRPIAPTHLVPAPTPAFHRPFAAVAIGISTGGPNALGELIPALPADLPVPVLIVQHMPAGFTASLAQHLARRSKIQVKEAEDGEPIRPGTAYIAPGGRHMVLRRLPDGGLIVGINDLAPVNSCRPSVDVLFRSMAAQVDGPVLAVVMTGMGMDGCDGVRTLKRRSGHCLTQTEQTCVVYGMPLAVDEAGLSDERVPLEQLARRISSLAGRRTPHGG